VQLWRSADSPRVEEIETGGVTAEKAVEVAEIEGVAARDEERPLLLIVRLVRGQIDGRWIDFDLSEIGVDRGIEREARREQILYVRASGHASIRAVMIGISGLGILELLA